MACDLQLVLGHDKVQSGRADLDLLQDRRHPDARLRRQVPDLALDGARPYARRLPPGDGLPDRPVPARAEEKIVRGRSNRAERAGGPGAVERGQHARAPGMAKGVTRAEPHPAAPAESQQPANQPGVPSLRQVSTTESGFSEIDSMPCSTSQRAKST